MIFFEAKQQNRNRMIFDKKYIID